MRDALWESRRLGSPGGRGGANGRWGLRESGSTFRRTGLAGMGGRRADVAVQTLRTVAAEEEHPTAKTVSLTRFMP